MGIDAYIEFQCERKVPRLSEQCRSIFEVHEIREHLWCISDSTHEVDIASRFYNENYPRGDWPYLYFILTSLLACKDVTKVWYGGGDGKYGMDLITINDVVRINDFYLRDNFIKKRSPVFVSCYNDNQQRH